ncbi:unnamed protein product [Adineta steineri]|uniref:Uncharacterized protein n=1 Tax=Adineta steineri TaxID=433720 RepID=A0A819SNU0_9BILA|nr:unnamed protein product [Adineta steineri]CAF4067879.1 unnamed protein product [Adineta steineri]
MSEDLDAYLGRDVNQLQNELKGKGYTVVIVGNDEKVPSTSDSVSSNEKRIVLQRGKQDPNKVMAVFEGQRAVMQQEEIIISKAIENQPKLDDHQQYMGRNVSDVSKELEKQGYTVHLVRVGPCATGCVPLARSDEKRIVLTYDGNNEDKVIHIREGINDGERLSDHGNMQWKP